MRTLRGIMWGVIACLILTLLFGCKSAQNIPTASNDSVRTVIRTQTQFVKDTVWLNIPLQQADKVIKDSTSHLENDYAISDVKISADGTLHHTLSTKPQSLPQTFDKPIITRDSITDKTSTKIITKTVPRELTWLQKAEIYGFRILMLILLILFAIRNRK